MSEISTKLVEFLPIAGTIVITFLSAYILPRYVSRDAYSLETKRDVLLRVVGNRHTVLVRDRMDPSRRELSIALNQVPVVFHNDDAVVAAFEAFDGSRDMKSLCEMASAMARAAAVSWHLGCGDEGMFGRPLGLSDYSK